MTGFPYPAGPDPIAILARLPRWVNRRPLAAGYGRRFPCTT